MKTKPIAAVFLTLGLALAGWQIFLGTSRAGVTTGLLPVAATAPKPAPDLKLTDLDGKPVSLADLRGKVVLLNFWATWCAPCQKEIPDLITLQKKYADQGLVVVGVSMDEGGVPDVKAFVQKAGVNYPIALGTQPVAEAYEIQALPASFIIDRKGKLVNGIDGAGELKDFESAVTPALQAKPKS